MILSYSWKLVSRNRLRSLTFLFGMILAVGLFSGILFFIDTLSRGMTEKALAPVSLDLVAHATRPDVDIGAMAGDIAKLRGISHAEAVMSADFSAPVTGRMFAMAGGYLESFPLARFSEGGLSPGSVAISESMAVGQKLHVGDRLSLSFPGLPAPVDLPISGIVNLDGADALFATANEAENALVSDVAFVDAGWFTNNLAAPLAKVALDPSHVPLPGTVVLDKQIHIRLDRNALPADPTAGAIQADALRRSIERQFSGDLKAVDNVSGALKNVKSDVLSAKILFIFLGLPGVILAAFLSKFAAELFAEARRKEIGLLRTRGARPGQVIGIVAVSTLLLSFAGSILGLILGWLLVALTGVPLPLSRLTEASVIFSAVLSFTAGLILSFVAGFIPSLMALRREVLDDRKTVQRNSGQPFWKKAWLDVVFLVLSAGVLILTQMNGGFKPTGNEGQAVELSVYIFLSPLLAWIGLTMLTMRLVEAFLKRKSTLLPRVFQSLFGGMGRTTALAMPRRARELASAATVIALTLSFGISLLIFQTTYRTEKQLDARYVVGADLRVTPALSTPQTNAFAQQIAQLPEVSAVAPVLRDTMALVGMEKNTVYGIDVPSFRQTAFLPDSFFVDGNSPRTLAALRDKTSDYAPGKAATVLDTLAQTTNGVIISVEQAQKYNIQIGDPVLIKLYNRFTGEYHPITARAVGLFVYFPTSNQDSDFILNSAYMSQNSGTAAIDNVLVKTDGQPASIGGVSQAVADLFKNRVPVRIQNIDTVIKVDSSSLTSLNIGGLGMLELVYTVIVASLGLGIFLMASINERQRQIGTMRACGADARHLKQFLFSESLTVVLTSLVLGMAAGVLLAGMFVLLLSVVFTIPPQGMDIPWASIGSLLGIVVLGMLASTLASSRRLSRIKIVEALREL